MPLDPLQKVPAVFKKDVEHLLTSNDGPLFEDKDKPYVYRVEDVSDGNQKPGIIAGKQLMIYPAEAYGQTYWHDPNGNQPSIFVGIGHVAMPEHADKSREELIELGYQFHDPRADFEPVYPLEHFEPGAKSKKQLQKLVVPPTPPVEETTSTSEEPQIIDEGVQA